jgi:hypothetical protein
MAFKKAVKSHAADAGLPEQYHLWLHNFFKVRRLGLLAGKTNSGLSPLLQKSNHFPVVACS